MRRALALLVVLLGPTTACNTDDCYNLTKSGPLGAFLVGGGGPADAYLVCDTLPSPHPIHAEALTASEACAPVSGDDACLACVKTSCCAAALACVGEAACACVVACRSAGDTLASCSAVDQCGATGTVYDQAAACVAEHCADPCPRLR